MLYDKPCKIVTTKTSDGLALHGAHFPAQFHDAAKEKGFDAVLLMHGAGANFYSVGFYEKTAPVLIDFGMDVFCVNNRGHDLAYGTSQGGRYSWQGAAFEHVGSAHKDIDAWLQIIGEHGFQRVLLIGHSLGAIKVLLSQAFHRNPLVAGIVACSPPRLSYSDFVRGDNREQFLKAYELVSEKVEQGESDEIIRVTFPFPLLISAGNYVDKYGPEENYNVLRFTDLVSVPTLLLFGERELKTNISFRDLDRQLIELTQGQSNFSHAIVPDADHFYTGADDQLNDAIRKWMAS